MNAKTREINHEFVGQYQFNSCEMIYVYVCRGSDGKIMARCESETDARLVARLLDENDQRDPKMTGFLPPWGPKLTKDQEECRKRQCTGCPDCQGIRNAGPLT